MDATAKLANVHREIHSGHHELKKAKRTPLGQAKGVQHLLTDATFVNFQKRHTNPSAIKLFKRMDAQIRLRAARMKIWVETFTIFSSKKVKVNQVMWLKAKQKSASVRCHSCCAKSCLLSRLFNCRICQKSQVQAVMESAFKTTRRTEMPCPNAQGFILGLEQH